MEDRFPSIGNPIPENQKLPRDEHSTQNQSFWVVSIAFREGTIWCGHVRISLPSHSTPHLPNLSALFELQWLKCRAAMRTHGNRRGCIHSHKRAQNAGSRPGPFEIKQLHPLHLGIEINSISYSSKARHHDDCGSEEINGRFLVLLNSTRF